jgi:coenzyme PQQ precursor peptide PqqA
MARSLPVLCAQAAPRMGRNAQPPAPLRPGYVCVDDKNPDQRMPSIPTGRAILRPGLAALYTRRCPKWRRWRMSWTTPTLVEICVGLEINGYLPAEF